MNIFTYNFYSRPSNVFNDGQNKRTSEFKQSFEVYESVKGTIDVVLFQELFDGDVYSEIKTMMKIMGFKYRTSRVNKKLYLNGGGVIFSRHKIMDVDELPFKSANIFNALSLKGLNYVKILFNNKYYHICNLHLDSFEEKHRLQQMKDIKKFLDLKYIPHTEPIIIGGDWNIKMERGEIDNVQSIFTDYTIGKRFLPEDKSLCYTVHEDNDWIKRRTPIKEVKNKNYWIDFFVYKNIETQNKMEVVQLRSFDFLKVKKIVYSTPFYFNIYNPIKKTKVLDLSDHYGVFLSFRN